MVYSNSDYNTIAPHSNGFTKKIMSGVWDSLRLFDSKALKVHYATLNHDLAGFHLIGPP